MLRHAGIDIRGLRMSMTQQVANKASASSMSPGVSSVHQLANKLCSPVSCALASADSMSDNGATTQKDEPTETRYRNPPSFCRPLYGKSA